MKRNVVITRSDNSVSSDWETEVYETYEIACSNNLF
jgi:hypothetical protein